MQLQLGTVKCWFDASGFGFIARDGAPDLYVCHRAIVGQHGRRSLVAGESVEFEIGENERGPCAVRVRRVDG